MTKQKYTFSGWFTQNSGGSRVTESTVVWKNLNVYAQWKKVTVKKPVIKSKKTGRTAFKITWGKVPGAKGYELRYSTDSDMYYVDTITTRKLKKTVKGLEAWESYYIQIRAYKYDSTGGKVFSSWSKKVNVITG